MPNLKVLFLGTPTFALDSLSALLNDDFFKVVGVVTQPDKAIGRSNKLVTPPIKDLALKNGLNVFQPVKIKDALETIQALKPDIIIVVAYGQIIPDTILQIPKYGCINVHGSLLPKYRGAAVVQAPIINGDPETGVTIMVMDSGLDTGPILSQEKISLAPNETTALLFPKLSKLGASLLVRTIKKYIAGQIFPKPQDNTRASKVGLINKVDGLINWSDSATAIERQIRAMNPWPMTFTNWQDKTLKIIAAKSVPLNINQYEPGETFMHYDDFAVQCGINALIITELQLEGKNAMTSTNFLMGNSKIIHQILGKPFDKPPIIG
ncbi:MAG: methionyl-tRNA formyltransferase [bacterium]